MSPKGTIYLVDDDPFALRGLTRLLRAGGYEVKPYVSPGELLQDPIADENACLVLDARMPGMSGFELQTAIAEKGVTLPVIFVTAEDDDAARDSARAVNAAGFFRKPVDGPALIDAIGWALDTHKKHIAPDKAFDLGFPK
jgi:FixJ family two-component response regulator